MLTRTYIVAVVLLACTTGWCERTAAVPSTQPGAIWSATQPFQEPTERRAFRALAEWEHAGLVLQSAEAWDLSPFVLLALLWAESRLDCAAVNKRSLAGGCGQFTRAGVAGLNRIRRARGDTRIFTRALAFDPREGIEATAELLASLVDRWGLFRGVAWYNGGPRRRAFALQVFRRVDYYRTRAGLPPMRDEDMGRKKRQKRPENLTRQGVPDLNHLAGPPPKPRTKVVVDVECHQCGRDAESCECWKRAREPFAGASC